MSSFYQFLGHGPLATCMCHILGKALGDTRVGGPTQAVARTSQGTTQRAASRECVR